MSSTLLPYGPEASEMAVEHVEDGHPEPTELEYAAKCPLCYAGADAERTNDTEQKIGGEKRTDSDGEGI